MKPDVTMITCSEERGCYNVLRLMLLLPMFLIMKLTKLIVEAVVIIRVILVENGTVEDVWMLNHLC